MDLTIVDSRNILFRQITAFDCDNREFLTITEKDHEIMAIHLQPIWTFSRWVSGCVIKPKFIISASQQSCGKVMFSQVSVILSTGRDRGIGMSRSR